jgi:hypothetical protein
MRVWVELHPSGHPDDRRLTESHQIELEVEAVPRVGELLCLPWPIQDLDRPVGPPLQARVTAVEHRWSDLDDQDEWQKLIPILDIWMVAVVLNPERTHGPWE